jgi:hypothetical protein
VTPRIEFPRSPADVTIGDGLTIAARYWSATVERWVLAVAAVALVNGLVSWLFRDSLLEQAAMNELARAAAGGEAIDPSALPPLVASPIAVAAVTIVAGWFLAANAIAGLRGTEVTLAWVLPAGLRAFVSSLLIGATIVLAVTTTLVLGILGVVVLLALVPVVVYLLIRIGFWELAIFDGASIGGGVNRSWRLTRRAVLRAFGWSLAVLVLGIGLFLVELLVTATVGIVSRPVASAINGGLDLAFAAYNVIVLAVLYESQRARTEPIARVEPLARSPYDPPAPPGG